MKQILLLYTMEKPLETMAICEWPLGSKKEEGYSAGHVVQLQLFPWTVPHLFDWLSPSENLHPKITGILEGIITADGDNGHQSIIIPPPLWDSRKCGLQQMRKCVGNAAQ
jgi:hypothetical protein